MFSYYGSKSKIVHLYPPPMFTTIVEPFAGSARYALRYADRKVILNDLDPTIAGIWRYLINEATPERIEKWPSLEHLDRLDSSKFSHLSKWEMEFIRLCSNIGEKPAAKIVTKMAGDGRYRATYNRAKKWVSSIKHWRILSKTYDELPDIEATWFIDPPYCGPAGRCYKYNRIDYAHLAEWCRTRKGQVIVCEGAGAEWLPFRPLGTTANGSKRSLNAEKWWSNYRRASLWEKVAGAKDWVSENS